MRIRVGEEASLIQPRQDRTDRRGLCFSAQVVAREIKRKPRSDIALLAGRKFIPQADRRNSRDNDSIDRQISVARNDLDSPTDVHRVAR